MLSGRQYSGLSQGISIQPSGHITVTAHSFLKAKEIKTFFPKNPQINPPYQRVTWRAILATSYTPQQGSCQQKRIHTRFSNYAKKSSDLSQICKVGADIYKTLCRSHWRRRKFIKHRFYHFQLHLEAVLLIVFTIYIIASSLYNFKTSVNREE